MSQIKLVLLKTNRKLEMFSFSFLSFFVFLDALVILFYFQIRNENDIINERGLFSR